MSGIKQRKEALHRYLVDDRVNDICSDLGHSQKWFYKQKEPYSSGNPDLIDRSRSPHRQTNRTNQEPEQLIVEIRNELMPREYARIGPQAINWELRQLGYSLPSIATMRRIDQLGWYSEGNAI